MGKVKRIKDVPFNAHIKNYCADFPMCLLNDVEEFAIHEGYWSEGYKRLDVTQDVGRAFHAIIWYLRVHQKHHGYMHVRIKTKDGRIMATGVIVYASLSVVRVYTAKLSENEKSVLKNFGEMKMHEYNTLLEEVFATYFSSFGTLLQKDSRLKMQYFAKCYIKDLEALAIKISEKIKANLICIN